MKNKGPEWEYVVVCPPDEGHKSEYNRCKLCQHEFQGGAPRIRGHFLKDKKSGVGACKAEDEKLGPVAKVMQGIEDSSKRTTQQGTEKRALDRATSSTAASTASASKKQRTLGDCVRGATKEECDEACGRMTSGDGLPESLVESPFFRDFVDKVRSTPMGWREEVPACRAHARAHTCTRSHACTHMHTHTHTHKHTHTHTHTNTHTQQQEQVEQQARHRLGVAVQQPALAQAHTGSGAGREGSPLDGSGRGGGGGGGRGAAARGVQQWGGGGLQ